MTKSILSKIVQTGLVGALAFIGPNYKINSQEVIPQLATSYSEERSSLLRALTEKEVERLKEKAYEQEVEAWKSRYVPDKIEAQVYVKSAVEFEKGKPKIVSPQKSLKERIADHPVVDDQHEIEISRLEKFIESSAKYEQGPTMYAGTLRNSDDVRVLEKEGREVKEAIGLASFYSTKEGFHTTATGAPFRDDQDVVAVNERLGYKLPCVVRITNLENGKSVYAAALDHGPYEFDKKGNAKYILKKEKGRERKVYVPHPERIVDASPKIARELGYESKGLAKVKVEYVGSISDYEGK